MSHHEPCAPGEVFLGNTLMDGEHFRWLKGFGLKTIRLGRVAYDIDGRKLSDSEGYSPVFIDRSEEPRHNEIMMEKTFGPYWRR